MLKIFQIESQQATLFFCLKIHNTTAQLNILTEIKKLYFFLMFCLVMLAGFLSLTPIS